MTSACHIIATVKIRRDWIAEVKPEAEITDGMRHPFTYGWEIEKGASSIYVGETAWIPEPEGWPLEAPGWIASGDLVEIFEVAS